jgi:[lysine-biosynthesis-protein LysW]--L-2-aminoadipate ligase
MHEPGALFAPLLRAQAPVPQPHGRRPTPRVILAASPGRGTDAALAAAWSQSGISTEVIAPCELRSVLRKTDVVVARLDVLPSLDGVEPGLLDLLLLERGGATVLNGASALLAAHDKLRTARRLERAGVPHPRTVHLRAGERPTLPPPLVVKPRFGSWGSDVHRCHSQAELERCLERVAAESWFRRHGALVQELVPPPPRDLRVLVAGGEVVGAIERAAAPGDWRTNYSLGGTRTPAVPPADATALALAAAAAIGTDLAGVDLLPCPGGFTVLELNGAADFDALYSLPGRDVFADAAAALGLRPGAPATHDERPRRAVNGAGG